jgi:hypothetical protein
MAAGSSPARGAIDPRRFARSTNPRIPGMTAGAPWRRILGIRGYRGHAISGRESGLFKGLRRHLRVCRRLARPSLSGGTTRSSRHAAKSRMRDSGEGCGAPDLVGPKPSEPYHFLARMGTFQRVAAPFPSYASALAHRRRYLGGSDAAIQKGLRSALIGRPWSCASRACP